MSLKDRLTKVLFIFLSAIFLFPNMAFAANPITINVGTFHNTYSEGTLVVKNNTTSPIASEINTAFSYTVTFSDDSIDRTINGVSFIDGVGTFTLTNGASKTFADIPSGVDYEVVADGNNDFDTVVDSGNDAASGTVSGTKTVVFNNSRKVGTLKVTNNVTSNVSIDLTGSKSFSYSVTLDKMVTNSDFTNGVSGSFTLSHSGTKTFRGIPVGVGYTVTQVVDADFITTGGLGKTGTISKSGVTAAFENVRKTGTLIISNTVSSNIAAVRNEAFKYTVTLDTAAFNKSTGTPTWKNGVSSTITIRGTDSVTLTGLPIGSTYEVEQTAHAAFVTTKSNDTGSISSTPETASFTNTYDPTVGYVIDISEGAGHTVVVDGLGDQSYTGQAIIPDISVTVDGVVLSNDDFDVELENNTMPGKATVKITGKRYYTGTFITYFNILDISGATAWEAAAIMDGVSQMPSSGDELVDPKTVVPDKTKWKLPVSFNCINATSSNPKAIKLKLKKDKSKSTDQQTVYTVQIQTKKAGSSIVTLEGPNGEKAEYEVFVEKPKFNKNKMKVTSLVSVNAIDYITGLKYMSPSKMESKKPNVATIDDNGTIQPVGKGSTKIIYYFGKKKLKCNFKVKITNESEQKTSNGEGNVAETLSSVIESVKEAEVFNTLIHIFFRGVS